MQPSDIVRNKTKNFFMSITFNEKPTAFITGATSGIGLATAKIFAAKKINLVICGRRKKRLNELKKELSRHTKVFILEFDVRDKNTVFEAIASLPEEFSNIDILINNAGNAHGLDSIEEGSLDDWEAMLDINVKGLLYVSKAIMPGMIKKKIGTYYQHWFYCRKGSVSYGECVLR